MKIITQSDLKECPFCSYKDLIIYTSENPSPHMKEYPLPKMKFYVHCKNCDAEGPTSFSKETCVMLWNKRNENN